jgi:hypothetical protein
MIKEYLKTWDASPSPKPCNDPEFIAGFLEFMRERDCEHYEFTGDNGYCGHTAIIYDIHPQYSYGRQMAFELAYGAGFTKVFTAHHNGFWVPEYISLKGGEAAPIISILHEKFIQWGGFAV